MEPRTDKETDRSLLKDKEIVQSIILGICLLGAISIVSQAFVSCGTTGVREKEIDMKLEEVRFKRMMKEHEIWSKQNERYESQN